MPLSFASTTGPIQPLAFQPPDLQAQHEQQDGNLDEGSYREVPSEPDFRSPPPNTPPRVNDLAGGFGVEDEVNRYNQDRRNQTPPTQSPGIAEEQPPQPQGPSEPQAPVINRLGATEQKVDALYNDSGDWSKYAEETEYNSLVELLQEDARVKESLDILDRLLQSQHIAQKDYDRMKLKITSPVSFNTRSPDCWAPPTQAVEFLRAAERIINETGMSPPEARLRFLVGANDGGYKRFVDQSLMTVDLTKLWDDWWTVILDARETRHTEDADLDEYIEATFKVQIEEIDKKYGSLAGGPLNAVAKLMLPGGYTQTSGYGGRIHPITGDHRMHTGVDFGAPLGATLHAAGGGTVVFSGTMGGYGETIIIDHGDKLTLYGHLSGRLFAVGTSVEAGAPIGYVGSTGKSTGPHLHFEVRVKEQGKEFGVPVNPMSVYS